MGGGNFGLRIDEGSELVPEVTEGDIHHKDTENTKGNSNTVGTKVMDRDSGTWLLGFAFTRFNCKAGVLRARPRGLLRDPILPSFHPSILPSLHAKDSSDGTEAVPPQE
jgi:hypothetical protein